MTIPTILKTELEENINNIRMTSSTIFRELIGNIFVNTEIWAEMNGKLMLKDLSEEIHASFSKL